MSTVYYFARIISESIWIAEKSSNIYKRVGDKYVWDRCYGEWDDINAAYLWRRILRTDGQGISFELREVEK